MILSGDTSHHFITTSIGCCFFLLQICLLSGLTYGRPRYTFAFLGRVLSPEVFCLSGSTRVWTLEVGGEVIFQILFQQFS